jgi:hypothetical protein
MSGQVNSRLRLPNRRRAVTASLHWPNANARPVQISAGFGTDGRIMESFIRGSGKAGSEANELLDDAAVLLSRLLQYGDRLDDIAAGLGHSSDGTRSSILGAAVDALKEMQGGER